MNCEQTYSVRYNRNRSRSKRVAILLFLGTILNCAPGRAQESAQQISATEGNAENLSVYTIPAHDDSVYLELNRASYPRFAHMQCGREPEEQLIPESSARPAFRIAASEQICQIQVSFAEGEKSSVAFITSVADYHAEAMQRVQILTVGMVGLSVLTLYLLSLSIALRNRIYVLFLFFSLTFLAYHALRTGFYREWGLHIPDLAGHLTQLMQLVYPGGLLLFVLEFRGAHRNPKIFHWMVLTCLFAGLVASVYLLPWPLVACLEMGLLTAGLYCSFRALRRKDGPGLLLSNAMLYICTLVANLLDPSLPVHPALEDISMIGGLLHILGVSGVIGFRIHNLRQGELRARHRSRQTWKAALNSLEQTRQTKREFMTRMGTRLMLPLEELQRLARTLLSEGSRAAEAPARRIIDESGRLMQLLVHTTSESEDLLETVSLARLTEDALTLLQLFPGGTQPRFVNDVDTDLHVRVNSDHYVRILGEFLENLSFLRAPEDVRISAMPQNGTVKVRIVFTGQARNRDGLDSRPVGESSKSGFESHQNEAMAVQTAKPDRMDKMDRMERNGRRRSGALMDRLGRDFLKQTLRNLDPEAGALPGKSNEFYFSLPGAEPSNPDRPAMVPESPEGPYALLYSEDILYGPRLQSRISEIMPCFFHNQMVTFWKQSPTVVVLDLLDLRSGGPASLMERIQQTMGTYPPILVLSRSDDRSLFPALAGQGLGDWITKPISTDLVVDRLQSLLSMNQKLEEQKKRYHSLARQNRSQIRRGLHDSLGAQLTDLKFLAEQLDRDGTGSILGQEVDRTIRMLQDSLQDLEDSQALATDMIPALEDNIVRRYTRASRKIRRDFEYKKLQLPAEVADDLFRVFQELVTNDLKYGTGTARWSLRSEADGIRVELQSSTRYDPSASIHGMGTASIMARVHDMGARIKMHIDQGIFFASIFLPAQIFAVYSPGND